MPSGTSCNTRAVILARSGRVIQGGRRHRQPEQARGRGDQGRPRGTCPATCRSTIVAGREGGGGQDIQASALTLLGYRGRRDGRKHQEAEDRVKQEQKSPTTCQLAPGPNSRPPSMTTGPDQAQDAGRPHQEREQRQHPAGRPRAMPLSPEHRIAIERRTGQPSPIRPIRLIRGPLLLLGGPRQATGLVRQTASPVNRADAPSARRRTEVVPESELARDGSRVRMPHRTG